MQMSVGPVLAAACSFLAASAIHPALAGDGQVHVMMIPLAGGGVEQIQYTGDVAPRVVMAPQTSFDPFVMLARISNMMDQQAAIMLRQMDAMPRIMMPNVLQGSSAYALVSNAPGNEVCIRSLRITFSGGDAAPKMVSSELGNCGPDHSGSTSEKVDLPATAPRPSVPHTIEVRAATDPVQLAWNR